MVTVDPVRFQAANALRTLERALSRLDALPQPPSATRRRMTAERQEWMTIDFTDVSATRALMRAWSEMDGASVALLEVLMELDEKAWKRWLAEVKSMLLAPAQGADAGCEANFVPTLTAVWAVERIPASLPQPATWRSLEGFTPETHARLQELREALTGALGKAFTADF